MLLQIDVYPNTFSVDAGSNELQSPPQSLLVSLNTSSSSTILTVGRKDALVVFGADKSVSRQHMTLELVSSHDFEKVDGKPLPRSPQGAVESDACSEYGMICVVKDSSKFGTYLVTGEKSELKKVDADDSTCDDETDDEGHASSAPQGSQLSSVATKIVDSADATLIKIDQPLALTNLCQPQGRVVIQVGQNGSTLVIHRVSIRIVLSRANKKIKDLWSSRSYLLGTTLLESVDTSITHLVTDARVTNAKSLTAWCLAKPLVTFEFLEALWNRHSPEDTLPDSAIYETPEADDGLTFWKEIPNPNLWSQTTMLSFGPKVDDMEALCRAAGSEIIEIDYHDNPRIAIEEIVQTNKGLFYVQSNSKSHAKIMKCLKTLNIPYVTQKTIALCVSQQAPLVADSNQEVIGTQVLAIRESAAVSTATKEIHERTPRSRTSSRLMSAPVEEPAGVPIAAKAAQERTPRSRTSSRLATSVEEPPALTTAAEGNEEMPSRSRKASRLTPAMAEEPTVMATAEKPTQERTSRSRTSSRLTPAPYDEPAPFDEPPIMPRSQRTPARKRSLITTSQLRPTPPEDGNDDDHDDDLPKEFARSHRKSRRLIPPAQDDDDAYDDENLPKTVSRSQGLSRRKEMAGESVEQVQIQRQTSQNDSAGAESNREESESSPASRKRDVGTEGDDCEDEETKPSKKAKRSLGGWTDVRKVARESELVDGTEVSTSNFDDDENENPAVGYLSQPNVTAHFGVRKALPKTSDGWLVKAPKERSEFKATEAEILDSLGDVSQLPPMAETVVVDSLVVSANREATTIHQTSSGVKDVRRFRKNSVKRVGELSRIQMRIVLPKASDRQMEIQEEQAALEASLREADILFHDSSGGIRGHFKPASRLKMRQV